MPVFELSSRMMYGNDDVMGYAKHPEYHEFSITTNMDGHDQGDIVGQRLKQSR